MLLYLSRAGSLPTGKMGRRRTYQLTPLRYIKRQTGRRDGERSHNRLRRPLEDSWAGRNPFKGP